MAATKRQRDARQQPRRSALQKKILLLLLGGLALGLTRDPRQYFRVIKEMGKEWDKINLNSLDRAVHSMYRSKLVTTKYNRDGTLALVLSKDGRNLALTYDIENMRVKTPSRWDGKWRIVMFDVPEPLKKVRDALRMHFKNMEFYEFQKSVFVHPYPCAKEIEYLMETYDVRKHVRFIVAMEIDNSIELKRHFHIG